MGGKATLNIGGHVKIKILKAGGYSFTPTGTVVIKIDPEDIGEEFSVSKMKLADGRTLSDEQAFALSKDKWVKITEDSSEDEPEDESLEGDENSDPEEEITDVEAHLKKLIEGKDDPEAKQLLKDFGLTRLDVNVSKSKTVENMIVEIVAAIPDDAVPE